MRKNKMMRLASMLLVLTLLSTCMISGTFAKYVTTATGSDSARVAKWGIKMAGNGSELFSDTYDASVDASVDSNDDADVVAPGTSGGVTYYVSGAPETDYVITFAGTKINEKTVGNTTVKQDVFLGAGKYTYTTDVEPTENTAYGAGMSQEVSTTYYPINYSVKISRMEEDDQGNAVLSGTGVTFTGFENGVAQTFETLDAAMQALAAASVTFETNEECGLKIEIAWAWQFADGVINTNYIAVDKGHTANDAYDTILGDLAAGNSDLTATDDASYNLDLGYTVVMTATQIN